jgi:hypothetical protein
LRSVGAAQALDVARLFGWEKPKADQAMQVLQEQGLVQTGLELDRLGGDWLALSAILQGV